MKFRALVLFLTIAALGLVAAGAPLAAPKKTQKKTAHKAVANAAVRNSRTAKKTPPASSGRRAATAARRPVGPIRQSAPTPERYKEIQSALVAKGYLKGDANGVWDAQSVDALRRYQADTKEDPTGRLTAVSLIGLGLGPATASLPSARIRPADVPPPPAVETVPRP